MEKPNRIVIIMYSFAGQYHCLLYTKQIDNLQLHCKMICMSYFKRDLRGLLLVLSV